MRRIAMIMLGLSLVVAACGDDDARSTDISGTVAATATSAAAESGTAATTAAETTTSVAAATTTAAATGPAGFIAAAAAYVGEYNGQWDNATFGSTGALFINVLEANTESGFVLIQVDIDGNAFGAADPDAFVIEISIDGEDLHVGFSEFLGASSFEIDEAGSFTMVAAPPILGLPLEVEGTIVGTGFGGSYSIPGLAEGTWSATPAG